MPPVEAGETVSEWLWRKNMKAESKWEEEARKVERLEEELLDSMYMPITKKGKYRP